MGEPLVKTNPICFVQTDKIKSWPSQVIAQKTKDIFLVILFYFDGDEDSMENIKKGNIHVVNHESDIQKYCKYTENKTKELDYDKAIQRATNLLLHKTDGNGNSDDFGLAIDEKIQDSNSKSLLVSKPSEIIDTAKHSSNEIHTSKMSQKKNIDCSPENNEEGLIGREENTVDTLVLNNYDIGHVTSGNNSLKRSHNDNADHISKRALVDAQEKEEMKISETEENLKEKTQEKSEKMEEERKKEKMEKMEKEEKEKEDNIEVVEEEENEEEKEKEKEKEEEEEEKEEKKEGLDSNKMEDDNDSSGDELQDFSQETAKDCFELGDVIWCKHGKEVWWPGYVEDRLYNARNESYRIKFFKPDEMVASGVLSRNIKKFPCNEKDQLNFFDEAKYKDCKDDLEKAVKQAQEYLLNQVTSIIDPKVQEFKIDTDVVTTTVEEKQLIDCCGKEDADSSDCDDHDFMQLPNKDLSILNNTYSDDDNDESDVEEDAVVFDKQKYLVFDMEAGLKKIKPALDDMVNGKVKNKRFDGFKIGSSRADRIIAKGFGPFTSQEQQKHITDVLSKWYPHESELLFKAIIPECVTLLVMEAEQVGKNEAERLLEKSRRVVSEDKDTIFNQIKNFKENY